MLILLYTKDEISYDRFHEKQNQIYRVSQTLQFGEQPSMKMGITNMVLGEAFKKEIPEVNQFVRINGILATVKKNNDVFIENPLLGDNNFFSVFTFRLLKGNPNTSLTDIHSIILSEESAKKYFGTTDVIGKTLQLKMNDQFEGYVVTGLVEKTPQNSTIKFEMLLPFEYYKKYNQQNGWFGGSLNTFLLLSSKADIGAVERKMTIVFNEHAKEEIARGEKAAGAKVKVSLGLQPLADIHLNTTLGPGNGLTDGSNPMYSYILTCIAVFILIIACINFINLAIGQSLKRGKEIGIRKVVGSSRKQLIKQFLIESFVVSLLAFIIAILLTTILLPFFNHLANKKLSLSYLADINLYIGYFFLLLVTSFIAGVYPSLVLSGFHPIKVLYSRQKLMGKNYFTRSLIVLQFALAIFLIIGAITVYSQLNFLFNQDMGYESKNLVHINMPPFAKENEKLLSLFKNEFAHQPSVVSIAGRNAGFSGTAVRADGKEIDVDYNKIDENFLPTFKISIMGGRNFSKNFPSDSVRSAIVNESFVKQAGWKNPIGKSIYFLEGDKKLTIIGVIKDYHFRSLKEKITPQLFSMDTSMAYGEIWIKIRPDNIPQTLSLVEQTYKKIVPFFPYDYQFMDNVNAHNYETETRWKQIIVIASILFIFISCIGLLGLVILSIEQRTKEIGIRKVLGAEISKIIILISKDFIGLILIAFLVAVPLGYYAVDKWLQDFAYRINISWWIFLFAGLLALMVALFTISFQAIKAGIANPVKSLRTE
ncbi:MAG: FtsX-like permease family protein [Ginsengibacter sp.]